MIIGGIDIETTGLEQAKGHRIIEVALSMYKHTEDETMWLGNFTQRINPERSIDPDAQAIHGIAYEDLIECPRWEDVAPRLSKLMAKCDYLVAHNGKGFDIPFILRELLRVGVELPRVRLVDTMLEARWATPDGAIPSLGKLAWACNVPYDTSKAHAALYDVRVMMDCFFSQLSAGYFKLPTREFDLNEGVKS